MAQFLYKTDLNQFDSQPDHENRPLYDAPPPHGSPGHGGQGVFFEFSLTDPQHKEAPFGAAAIIVINE